MPFPLGRALLPSLIGAAVLAAAAPASAQIPNQLLGTWIMMSAQGERDGVVRPLFGPHPAGVLFFTADMHFGDVITNPDTRHFAASDRTGGTAAENKAAVAGALALFGTYTVDSKGRFATEHVIGSSFPNWNGIDRDTSRITEDVQGDTMTERLQDPGGPRITIIWKRAR